MCSVAWQYFIRRKQENCLSFTFPTLHINPKDIFWYVGFQLPLCTLVDCQEASSVLFTACDIVYHHMTEFRSARKFIRMFCLSKFSLTLVKYDCFLSYACVVDVTGDEQVRSQGYAGWIATRITATLSVSSWLPHLKRSTPSGPSQAMRTWFLKHDSNICHFIALNV